MNAAFDSIETGSKWYFRIRSDYHNTIYDIIASTRFSLVPSLPGCACACVFPILFSPSFSFFVHPDTHQLSFSTLHNENVEVSSHTTASMLVIISSLSSSLFLISPWLPWLRSINSCAFKR